MRTAATTTQRAPARVWVWILSFVFLFAIAMGAGPGVLLVNPDPGDPAAVRFWLGMPVVYVWSVGWFLVEAVVVVLAYFAIWREPREEAA